MSRLEPEHAVGVRYAAGDKEFGSRYGGAFCPYCSKRSHIQVNGKDVGIRRGCGHAVRVIMREKMGVQILFTKEGSCLD